MPEDFIVRVAQPTDISPLVPLYRKFGDTLGAKDLPSKQAESVDDFKDGIMDKIGEGQLFVGQTRFGIIGFAEIADFNGLQNTADLAYLFVDPSAQRSGYAKALIRQVEEHVRGKGIKSLRIWTEMDNLPANALYQKLGYEKTPLTKSGTNKYQKSLR